MLTDYYLSDMDDANSGSNHMTILANTANGSRRIVQVWPTKNLSGWFLANVPHGNVERVHGPIYRTWTITTLPCGVFPTSSGYVALLPGSGAVWWSGTGVPPV